MESFGTKNIMIQELGKRNMILSGNFIYAKNPIELAGEWKYKFPPPPGKEQITPVEVDLIRKYQKND